MAYSHAIGRIGEVIDGAGVAVIVIGALINTGDAAIRLARRETGIYLRFRQQFGQTIRLGLELLVGGTSSALSRASPPSPAWAILAIIVLIRTFLSFSLEVELTGHWPCATTPPPARRDNPIPARPRRVGSDC